MQLVRPPGPKEAGGREVPFKPDVPPPGQRRYQRQIVGAGEHLGLLEREHPLPRLGVGRASALDDPILDHDPKVGGRFSVLTIHTCPLRAGSANEILPWLPTTRSVAGASMANSPFSIVPAGSPVARLSSSVSRSAELKITSADVSPVRMR